MGMFRNKATSYAILAAAEIARRRQSPTSPGVQAADIAQVYDLPTAYAAKIMSQLAKSQILRSDRGPRGGFQLARAPEKISLLEMFESVRGLLSQSGIHVSGNVPDGLSRTVSGAFQNANNAIRKRLGATTLADLIKK